MTFVNEKISSADLDGSDLLRSLRDFNGGPITTNHYGWAIDRERDARLIDLGGGLGPIPKFYALVWKGSNVEFQARREMKLRIEGEIKLVDENYTVLTQFIPKALAIEQKTIEQLIIEALICYAENKLGLTTVHFKPDVRFVEGLAYMQRGNS